MTQTCLEKYASAEEQKIARRLVRHLLKCGYELAVDDGEEITTPCTTDADTILAALATTGMDRIHCYVNGQQKSWVLLIWCNGEDLISDHGASLEKELRVFF